MCVFVHVEAWSKSECVIHKILQEFGRDIFNLIVDSFRGSILGVISAVSEYSQGV